VLLKLNLKARERYHAQLGIYHGIVVYQFLHVAGPDARFVQRHRRAARRHIVAAQAAAKVLRLSE
jgi:hypothetical protein